MQLRLRSIDVLRAVAACSVVAFHSNSRFTVGAAGVDLFFVISGFVIAGVIAQRPSPSFLADRALRIYPLYWLALVPWVIANYEASSQYASRVLMDALLFPRWFVPADSLLYLSWTLAFEILFYVGAAVSLRIGSARPVIAVYVALLVGWGTTGASYLQWIGNPIILEFLAGVLIFYARKVDWLSGPAVFVGAVLLLSNPSNSREVLEFSSAIGRATYWGIPAALIVYGLVSAEGRLTSPAVGRLCWLGATSYSIYLFHPLITALGAGPGWPTFTFGIAAGVAAWAIAERNLERWRKRWRKRSFPMHHELAPEQSLAGA